MMNSIIGLNMTPQKCNPSFLHTLEDLINDSNIHKSSQIEDWTFLKLIQEKENTFKNIKFINRLV